MTFLASKKKVGQMEREFRMWRQLAQRGNALARTNPTDPELAEIADEVEVLAQMTNWSKLKSVMLASSAFLLAGPLEASAAVLTSLA